MVNVEAMREKTFNIRFSEEEWERLDRLSAEYGINAASLIRMLLKKADTGGPIQRAMRAAAPDAQLERDAAKRTTKRLSKTTKR